MEHKGNMEKEDVKAIKIKESNQRFSREEENVIIYRLKKKDYTFENKGIEEVKKQKNYYVHT